MLIILPIIQEAPGIFRFLFMYTSTKKLKYLENDYVIILIKMELFLSFEVSKLFLLTMCIYLILCQSPKSIKGEGALRAMIGPKYN